MCVWDGIYIHVTYVTIQDFTRSVAHKGYNMYNSVHLQQMKTEFKEMVEDKFDRRMVKR